MDYVDNDINDMTDQTPDDPMIRRKRPVGIKTSLPPNQGIYIGDDMS